MHWGFGFKFATFSLNVFDFPGEFVARYAVVRVNLLGLSGLSDFHLSAPVSEAVAPESKIPERISLVSILNGRTGVM